MFNFFQHPIHNAQEFIAEFAAFTHYYDVMIFNLRMQNIITDEQYLAFRGITTANNANIVQMLAFYDRQYENLSGLK